MGADARHTIRNAGLLMMQRGFHVLGATLFAVMVPRMMGPAGFGRYALLMSVSLWFALLSGLGATSMLTRSVPRFTVSGDGLGLRRLVSSMLALRALTGAATAAGYFLVATAVLGEADLVAAAFVAAGVFSRTVGNLTYALFLGLNQAARWGLGELIRRWLALVFVPLGFVAAGFRGACLGYLSSELITLAVGIWWARRHLEWADVDLSRRHLGPYLRMGTLFAASGLLLVFTQRSGEPLLRFATGSYEEIGFFGAAYAIYLTGASAMWQFTIAFAPFLVVLLEDGRRDAVAAWLARILKSLVVVAVLAGAAVLFVGRELIPLLLGSRFVAVAANAVPLTLTLMALVVGMIGRLLVLVLDRPGLGVGAAGLELALFWAVGAPLAASYGSLGAAWATVPASAVYAAYISWRTYGELPYPVGAAMKALLLAVVFVPFAAVRSTLWLNVLWLAAASAAYLGLLIASHVFTPGELRELATHLRRRESPRAEAVVSSEGELDAEL